MFHVCELYDFSDGYVYNIPFLYTRVFVSPSKIVYGIICMLTKWTKIHQSTDRMKITCVKEDIYVCAQPLERKKEKRKDLSRGEET